MRISDWSSDVCSSDLRGRSVIDENGTAVALIATVIRSLADIELRLLTGRDSQRIGSWIDRHACLLSLRIAIDELARMRAQPHREAHQLLQHIDDPVIVARRPPSYRVGHILIAPTHHQR